MSTSTPLCQTCSSQLTPSALRLVFLPPCCLTPICAACIAHNPRLTDYVPCLRCGDLTTREGESKVIKGRRAQEWKEADKRGGETVFDVDEDEVDDLSPAAVDQSSFTPTREDAHDPLDHVHGPRPKASPIEAVDPSDEDIKTVEVTHPVARSDTLLAIARRYATDPHELLDLNKLPATALSSNPRILQTRKTIIISRRRVPRSQLAQSNDLIPDTPLNPEEAKRRAEERAVKRFQLVTKTVDPGVGKAYLSIQGESSDTPHPLELGSGEVLDEKTGGAKKSGLRADLSQEDRAVEQWFEDDEWEQQRVNGLAKKREGKWTRVGGSGSVAPETKNGEGIKL